MASKSTVKEKFEAAVNVIHSLPKNGSFQPSYAMMLSFYSLYKQATIGPCNIKKPAFYDVVGKAKWDAWSKLGQMKSETAMQMYVEELKKIIETMPHTENVTDFIEKLGDFYELIDEESSEGPLPKLIRNSSPKRQSLQDNVILQTDTIHNDRVPNEDLNGELNGIKDLTLDISSYSNGNVCNRIRENGDHSPNGHHSPNGDHSSTTDHSPNGDHSSTSGHCSDGDHSPSTMVCKRLMSDTQDRERGLNGINGEIEPVKGFISGQGGSFDNGHTSGHTDSDIHDDSCTSSLSEDEEFCDTTDVSNLPTDISYTGNESTSEQNTTGNTNQPSYHLSNYNHDTTTSSVSQSEYSTHQTTTTATSPESNSCLAGPRQLVPAGRTYIQEIGRAHV